MKNDNGNTKDRIVRIPGILGGKPVIKGTRIPVDLILERLTVDLDLKTLFEDYPELTEADIKACIAFAKELVRSAFTVCSQSCLDTAAQKKAQALHAPRRRDLLA